MHTKDLAWKLRMFSLQGFLLLTGVCSAQKSVNTMIEMTGMAGKGDYAPLWLTANRDGISTVENNYGFVRGGMRYSNRMSDDWTIKAGMELVVGYDLERTFMIGELYGEVKYRCLNLTVGSKKRNPELRNAMLTSGGLIEGNNARPVPQIRAGIEDYTAVPYTNRWLNIKGHVAYGRFADNEWQRRFAAQGTFYTKDVLYHSKSLFFKLGRKEKFPVELEVGFIGAAQFGGERYLKGNNVPVDKMPHEVDDYLRMLFGGEGGKKSLGGEQTNALGNHLGSWNFAATGYIDNWKVRGYYEHMFEDGSGMFLGYGAWKDGLLGVELTFPKKGWIDEVVYEVIGTKRQTASIMSEGWTDIVHEVIMGRDNYYNNWVYLAWQQNGMGLGNPLLTSPLYNDNNQIAFMNNRIGGHHVAIAGTPFREWTYRAMVTYTENLGTYFTPFDSRRCEWYGMMEIGYEPIALKGWKFTVSGAADRGSLLGNNVGMMLSVKRCGILNFK